MESPTSIRSADDGLLLSASQRHLPQPSPAYSASNSSEGAGVAAGIDLDLDTPESPAPAGGSFVPSLFESFVPLPSAPRDDAPSERGVSLDASRSIDLSVGLHAAANGEAAAGLAPLAAGYLSDSQVPRPARSSDGAGVFRPVLNRSSTRTRAHGHAALKHALAREGTVAPGQPGRVRRVRDKIMNVELGQDDGSDESLSTDARRVNVSAFCLAYEFDIVELERALVERFGSERVHAYPEDLKASQTADIVHARYVNETGDVCGDVFCFEFGIVVTWDLTAAQQTEVVWQLAGQHTAQRIPEADIEVDELDVEYGPTTHTTIKDDTLTMSKRLYDDELVRVAVSLALAQSTRISVQETQVMEMVFATKELPFQLVKHGSVAVPHDDLAILIGKVFLQKSALNLQVLSGHKETPKFFWGKPDNLQVIYHAVSDYLDLDERADILNRRFSALTDMLDLLRDQQCTAHSEHLEWIVIFLILITTCLGLLQIASLLRSEWIRSGEAPGFAEVSATLWERLAGAQWSGAGG